MALLTIALEPRPHTVGLLDGSIEPVGFQLRPTGTGLQFREMARDLAFDVAELAVVSYLAARDHDIPITALPVFVSRGVSLDTVLVHSAAGIREPKDLEGRRIGIRYYGFTDSMWVRGMLAESYDVDLDSITWVLSDDEHVAATVLPGNVDMGPGADLVEMLESGEIDGYIGAYRGASPSVRCLFDDPVGATRAWHAKTGLYPVRHLIAVRADVLDAYPDAAAALYQAFCAAKADVVARLAAGEPRDGAERALLAQWEFLGGDPLPYGIEANRPSLEAIVRYAHNQHLISRQFGLDELFVAHRDE